MNVIHLKKNKYVNNGVIDEPFVNLINKLSKNKQAHTLKTVSDIINNPINLSIILQKNKINYLNIKYIIFGIPKTGNSSLRQSIKNHEKIHVRFYFSILL